MCCSYGRSGGNYDSGLSRGKSYDRGVGGYQNSLSHGGGGSYESNGPGGSNNQGREISRSMSNDNWREVGKSSQFTDEEYQRGSGSSGPGGGTSRGWGNCSVVGFRYRLAQNTLCFFKLKNHLIISESLKEFVDKIFVAYYQ